MAPFRDRFLTFPLLFALTCCAKQVVEPRPVQTPARPPLRVVVTATGGSDGGVEATEQDVAVPLENVLRALPHVRRISTHVRAGSVSAELWFEPGIDAGAVRAALAPVRGAVIWVGPSIERHWMITTGRDGFDLRAWAEAEVRPLFERTPGVRRVSFCGKGQGIDWFGIRDRDLRRTFGVTLQEVMDLIGAAPRDEEELRALKFSGGLAGYYGFGVGNLAASQQWREPTHCEALASSHGQLMTVELAPGTQVPVGWGIPRVQIAEVGPATAVRFSLPKTKMRVARLSVLGRENPVMMYRTVELGQDATAAEALLTPPLNDDELRQLPSLILPPGAELERVQGARQVVLTLAAADREALERAAAHLREALRTAPGVWGTAVLPRPVQTERWVPAPAAVARHQLSLDEVALACHLIRPGERRGKLWVHFGDLDENFEHPERLTFRGVPLRELAQLTVSEERDEVWRERGRPAVELRLFGVSKAQLPALPALAGVTITVRDE